MRSIGRLYSFVSTLTIKLAKVMKTDRNFLGYTEEITVCGCCGKNNLKGTYAVEISGSGLVFYGSSCVQKTFNMTARSLERTMTRIGRKNNGSAIYRVAF